MKILIFSIVFQIWWVCGRKIRFALVLNIECTGKVRFAVTNRDTAIANFARVNFVVFKFFMELQMF